MIGYERYAIYVAPEPGALAEFAADWLGWDAASAAPRTHPAVAGLPRGLHEITATPRKYGFHGTIKPPFRLMPGTTCADLHVKTMALCARLAPVTLTGLVLHRLGGFLALVPEGDQTALAELAAAVVAGLDGFRAPPDAAETARRRPERLNPAQRAHLDRWGYPYVMDQFQFHLTLTGDLPPSEAEIVHTALAPLITPLLPRPFPVTSLCLFGQAKDGQFHLLRRYPLSG
ncbi:MAG: DUF1045 domain-containing protein [Paracoccaceae bacterium]|nr:DUF1045 domain-containing protein [Paracoccaceae bacterium]